MSKERIIILREDDPEFRLRSIASADLEDLRVWKNRNKAYFFLKEDISPDQQASWFDGFLGRPDDFMFMVEQPEGESWTAVGCMGFRLLGEEGCVDAYNIMRGRRIEDRNIYFTDVFRTLLSFADSRYGDYPVRCKVLSDNPALDWYAKVGFDQIDDQGGHRVLELDKEVLRSFSITIQEETN